MAIIAGLREYYEYKIVCRKPGRFGGYELHYTDLDKALARKEHFDKRGFIVTVKQRKVTEWEEVRNACRDDD